MGTVIHGVELDFEAVKRVKLREEPRWTASIERYEVFSCMKHNKKEFGLEREHS